ncbi:MAG: flagellar biosynthesis protein FlhF [Chromatiales bacterium]|jgi:flagellar biosynthesis protein FlhF
MKIKRFFAADMRQALRQVRESLGADAVILSNKSVEGGVELVAAKDYDEAAFSKAATNTPAGTTQSASVVQPASQGLKRSRADSGKSTQGKGLFSSRQTDVEKPIQLERKPTKSLQPPSRIEWSQDPVLQEMRQEMQTMRRMMENELSELTWRDLGQHRPQTQELIRRLLGLGLNANLCRVLAGQVEDAESLDQAWRHALYHLIRKIPIMQDDLIDQGGVIALVGPTGVGKTTTIAKLAARFCLRHGNRQLALITTDGYRIGAQEQLHNYGRILDIPVRTATTATELSDVLHTLAEKRLILIDTAGMGQRDLQLTARLNMLRSGNHPVQALLTLAATTQRSAITHAIRAYSVIRPIAAVLTKIDEAASLGDAISPLVDAGLPLAFVTDGQRVPEDLHPAKARLLVERAIELVNMLEEKPAEEYMAYAYGGMGEHARI